MMNIHLIFYLLENKMEFVEKVLITSYILVPKNKKSESKNFFIS